MDFSALIERAIETDGGLEKMQQIIAMQQEALDRQARLDYFVAKSAMQAALPVIKKQKWNEHNRSFFASLDDVVLQITPVLEAHGFSFSWEQAHNHESGMIRVTCILTHRNGHQESAYIDALADTNGARGNANKTQVQGTASTITYLRRYTLTGIAGLATADNDIDGRIEGVVDRQQQKSLTASSTVNNILEHVTLESISDMLFSAQNLEQLNAAGKLIPQLAEEQQDEIKETYFNMREQFKPEPTQ